MKNKIQNKTRATSKKVALVSLITLQELVICSPWDHENLPLEEGTLSEVYANGQILWFTTSCHGGFFVTSKLNKQIPKKFRVTPGWYEEDEMWAYVVRTFPQYFTKYMRKSAGV